MKRRSFHEKSTWNREEVFNERESEFLRSINMSESIPQSSAAISIPKSKLLASDLRRIYRSSSLVNSLPCYSRFANRPSSMTTKYLNSLNDIRQLRSRSSEPNLIEYQHGGNSHQTIVISNQSGNKSNQIILKSSFSDQNLTANINADPKNFNCSFQYSDEPKTQNYTTNQCRNVNFVENEFPQIMENNSVISSSSSSVKNVRRRKLPAIPIRNTQSLYIPNSEHTKNFYELSPASPSRFNKSFSADASGNNYKSYQSLNYNYQNDFNSNFNEPSQSDNNPQFNFDSDTQYGSNMNFNSNNEFNSVQDNFNYNQNNNLFIPPFNENIYRKNSNQTEPIYEDVYAKRERSYSRENLKLDLKVCAPALSDVIKKDETIGSIIDNVRSQMLTNENLTLEERRSSLKMELEGKVFSPPKVSSPIVAKNAEEKKNILKNVVREAHKAQEVRKAMMSKTKLKKLLMMFLKRKLLKLFL